MIKSISVNINETRVTIDGNEITIHIKNLTLDLSVKTNSDSTDHFLDINGTGNYTAKSLDGKVTIEIKKNPNPDKLPLIELKTIDFNVTKDSLIGNFSGCNDLFLLANATSKLISSFIVGVLNFSIFEKKEIEKMLNSVSNSISTYYKIESYGIEFNISTIGDPAIVDGVLPIKLNGLLNCYDKSKCKPYNYKPKKPAPYDYKDVHKDLQIVITDYLLQEISILAYQKSLLTEDSLPKFYTDVKSMSDFLPAMEEHYKENYPVIITTEFYEPPIIEFPINDTKSIENCRVNVYVNLTNKIEQALRVNVSFENQAVLMVMNGNLTGEIKNFKHDIMYIDGKLKKSDIDDFKQFLNLALKLLLPQINDQLKAGIIIPPLSFYDFSNSSMILKHRNAIIGLNPKLSKLMYIDESFDWIAGKFFDSYNMLQNQKSELLGQQKASKRLIKTEL